MTIEECIPGTRVKIPKTKSIGVTDIDRFFKEKQQAFPLYDAMFIRGIEKEEEVVMEPIGSKGWVYRFLPSDLEPYVEGGESFQGNTDEVTTPYSKSLKEIQDELTKTMKDLDEQTQQKVNAIKEYAYSLVTPTYSLPPGPTKLLHEVCKSELSDTPYFQAGVDPIIPPHYNSTAITTFQVVSDWNLDFFLGNVVKYIQRSKLKGKELEDLKKASAYLTHKIKQLENGE